MTDTAYTDVTEAAMVTKSFLELFTDGAFCSDAAAGVTCTESGTISAMLVLLGGPDAARVWDEQHAAHDEPGDDHYTGADVDADAPEVQA